MLDISVLSTFNPLKIYFLEFKFFDCHGFIDSYVYFLSRPLHFHFHRKGDTLNFHLLATLIFSQRKGVQIFLHAATVSEIMALI